MHLGTRTGLWVLFAGVAGLTSACTLLCLPAFLFDQLAVAD